MSAAPDTATAPAHERLRAMFGVELPLIGMCHLLALPGRPRHDDAAGVGGVGGALRADVRVLQEAGVDGLLFCNEHDLPYQLEAGPEVVAGMAAAVAAVTPEVVVPFGVDVLWDAKAALAVARATGASFVREVFTGVFESDMGMLAPDLGALSAYRRAIGAADVALFVNVTPEFSRSVSGRPVADRARGARYMGADAILVSGPAAGVAASPDDLREAHEATPDVPVFANTGIQHDTVGQVLEVADGVIVGSALKEDGDTWRPVDPDRARDMVAAVRAVRARRSSSPR
jgi:membrane complex biogenesis BtpA family protein